MENIFSKEDKGMDIISHKGKMCYMVWKNAILSPGRQNRWLKSNRNLG